MTTKDIFFYSLGAIIVVLFFAVLIALIIKGNNPDAVNIMLGALTGAFGTVVGYWYGSSKGSADKTELLNQNITP